MPVATHTKAASDHTLAAKAHEAAAECHRKGEHVAAIGHSAKAKGMLRHGAEVDDRCPRQDQRTGEKVTPCAAGHLAAQLPLLRFRSMQEKSHSDGRPAGTDSIDQMWKRRL